MDFCSKSNISEALQQLSEEIAILGFSSIPEYDFKSNDSNFADVIVSLSNIVWNLLKSRQKLVDKVRECNQHQCTLNDEIKCLKVRINQLEDELSKNEKVVKSTLKQGITIKNRQTIVDTDMKKLKQELLRTQGLLKSRAEQTTIKLRESQEENAELRRKLNKMLLNNTKNGDNKENKIPMPEYTTLKHVNNPTARNELESSLQLKKEELYRKSILKLQSNIQTLASENIKLKKNMKDK